MIRRSLEHIPLSRHPFSGELVVVLEQTEKTFRLISLIEEMTFAESSSVVHRLFFSFPRRIERTGLSNSRRHHHDHFEHGRRIYEDLAECRRSQSRLR